MSQRKIAKKLNIGSTTVFSYMRKFNIPTRFKNSGRIIGGHGYIRIRKGNKYLFEHRLVIEKHLGRKLEKNEFVHHIDFDKKNNNINNLTLYKGHGKHRDIETSLYNCVKDLIKMKVLTFDKEKNQYEVSVDAL